MGSMLSRTLSPAVPTPHACAAVGQFPASHSLEICGFGVDTKYIHSSLSYELGIHLIFLNSFIYCSAEHVELFYAPRYCAGVTPPVSSALALVVVLELRCQGVCDSLSCMHTI